MIYIVGKSLDGPNAWEILGAFGVREEALRHCITERHFVAPLEMDKHVGEERSDWPGIVFPLAPVPSS